MFSKGNDSRIILVDLAVGIVVSICIIAIGNFIDYQFLRDNIPNEVNACFK